MSGSSEPGSKAHRSEFNRCWHFPVMEAPTEPAADRQAFFAPLQ